MVVRNLMLRAGADFSSIQKAMKKAGKDTKKFRQSFTNTAKNIGRVMAIAGAAITAVSVKSIAEAEDSIVVQTKLSTIMKQRMNATDAQVQSIKDLVSAQMKLGVVEDDTSLSGAQMLGTFLHSTESLKTLIPAMNDLAVQQEGVNTTSEGLVNIGKMMGKVFTGQTGALKKAGISFTAAQEKVMKYGTESEKAAMLAQVITDNVGKMNKAMAGTSPGMLKQLKDSFGELQEKFGNAILPIRNAFIPALQKAVEYTDGFIDRMRPAIQYAQVFLETLFNVKSAKNASVVTGAVSEESGAISDLGDSADEAKKSLLGFDEINSLQDNSGSLGDTADEIAKNAYSTEELNNELLLTSDQIKDAKEQAEKFKEVLTALRDICIGFATEGKRLYDKFVSPFISKIMGWDGKGAATDFKTVGARLLDIAIAIWGIKKAADAVKGVAWFVNLLNGGGKAAGKAGAAGGGSLLILGEAVAGFGLMVGGVYALATALERVDDWLTKITGHEKDVFGSGSLLKAMSDSWNFVTTGQGKDPTNYAKEKGITVPKTSTPKVDVKAGFTAPAGGSATILSKPLIDTSGVTRNGVTSTRVGTKAGGGFVDRGEMFIAREKGPELVGTIGKSTAVANNYQIEAGIEAGTYRGVKAAMQGGNQVIKLFIGGVEFEQIVAKTFKGHSRRTGEAMG